jgi:nucleoid-associated protein YgaU
MAVSGANVANNLTHTINKLRIVQVERTDAASSSLSFGDVAGGLNALLKMFEVQINPDKYVKGYKINYTNPNAIGRDGTQSQTYNRMEAQKLTLNFTLDGTGVIPASATDITSAAIDIGFKALDAATRLGGVGMNDVTYVTRRIEELKKIVYGFNNTTHEPPTVMVIWGDVDPFKGKLEDLQITYTLFHPSGAPLRADIQVQFGEHNATGSSTAGAIVAAIGAVASVGGSVTGALLASPDLTHRRIVKATDTLPLLCEEIYKDASFYWQVAEANNLTHFRELEVGSELFFPPIER